MAESLGINKDLIYHWRKWLQEKGKLAFPGKGKQLLTAEQERIKQLERKLKKREGKLDILKKHWSLEMSVAMKCARPIFSLPMHAYLQDE